MVLPSAWHEVWVISGATLCRVVCVRDTMRAGHTTSVHQYISIQWVFGPGGMLGGRHARRLLAVRR